MDYYDLKREFGTYKALAERIGVHKETVRSWKRLGIPLGRQYQLAALSEGRLKVEDPVAKRTKSA